MVYGRDFQHPNHLVREATEILNLHHYSLQKLGREESNTMNGELQRWGCPPMGFLKINWDVAIDAKTKSVSFGIVIRDHNGSVRAAKRSRINMVTKPVAREAMGTMVVIEFYKERGFQNIILEGNSLQVIHGLKERTPNWGWYGHLLDDT